jgi:hypothetical protein
MSQFAGSATMSAKHLTVSTWNIAAINNNPFEYWITMADNPEYNALMLDVESFIENPGSKDIPVHQVFTSSMFDQLEAKMLSIPSWGGAAKISKVRGFWESSFKDRKIISGFLKDKSLGDKRLSSMPDRVTNTINVVGSSTPVCRPTVINMYDGDLSTLDMWFNKWSQFMFDTDLTIKAKDGTQTMKVHEMLGPIKSSKYPAITVEEEDVSIPLQTLASAINDAVLVHMLNEVATPSVWQPLKAQIVSVLNKKKVPNTLNILASNLYRDTHVVCLQEVSGSFIDEVDSVAVLKEAFHVVAPAQLDSKRDQNSVILLSKAKFPNGSSGEITTLIEASFVVGADIPVAKGDILAITATDANNNQYVIGSFHGDTNGLATVAVVKAFKKAMENDESLKDRRLIFGLDANTYEKEGNKKFQGVQAFGTEYRKLGLTSNWGDVPISDNYTTYNARTYLQTQLNKACKSSEKKECGDVNPKDFILFDKTAFGVVSTTKDNTGNGVYNEDMPFPTMEWPSDHGLSHVVLKEKE